MARLLRSRRTTLTLAGGVGVLCSLAVALAIACSPDRKEQFLRTFFDGYPPEKSEKSGQAKASPTSAPAQDQDRPPDINALGWDDRISEAHEGIAEDCDACHSPTKMVTVGMCLGCHDLKPHAGLPEHHRCTLCHMEHQGRNVSPKTVAVDRCLPCHAFAPFETKHPPFDVLTSPQKALAAQAKRGLWMVHSVHAEIECATCHEPKNGGFAPVQFARTCGDCHDVTDHSRSIEFDWTEVKAQVSPDLVPAVLASNAGFTWYVSQLKDEAKAGALRSARQVVATGDREQCFLCHSADSREENGRALARIQYVQADAWLPAAKFSHQTHEAVDCTTCHAAAKDSAQEVVHLMLPGQQTCAECHNADGAPASCFACHHYHPG